jgi:hypothetical protein
VNREQNRTSHEIHQERHEPGGHERERR